MSSAEREAVVQVTLDAIELVEWERDAMWRRRLVGVNGAIDVYVRWAVSAGVLLGQVLHERIQRVVDAETAELVEQLLRLREGRLPCGHRHAELVAGDRVITHCRRCRADGRSL